jgi:hypothetical protein
MTPKLVAKVMRLVFGAAGRDVPDDAPEAWHRILEDLDDGPDVLELTALVIRDARYVTAGEIHRALVAHRLRHGAGHRTSALALASGETLAGPDVARHARAAIKLAGEQLRARSAGAGLSVDRGATRPAHVLRPCVVPGCNRSTTWSDQRCGVHRQKGTT